ncbi:anaerobic ribonucleoside-triphosphate reductase [Natrinema sp. SYSU A 869]|uniref:anaerobic ribonucleoside-triphosphate reductase n=1 Tax=Natrinema sp. SYSU A 869 TaxID=2871694 RepID=UPI001CA3CB2A|nr:anaerobic ribonucleoside-triphosphate reductase [Natrinema sp. SYSU A 869]
MVSDQMTHERSRCRNCGFEAPGGDDEWRRITVPKLGRMTQCPDCGSTDVITSR